MICGNMTSHFPHHQQLYCFSYPSYFPCSERNKSEISWVFYEATNVPLTKIQNSDQEMPQKSQGDIFCQTDLTSGMKLLTWLYSPGEWLDSTLESEVSLYFCENCNRKSRSYDIFLIIHIFLLFIIFLHNGMHCTGNKLVFITRISVFGSLKFAMLPCQLCLLNPSFFHFTDFQLKYSNFQLSSMFAHKPI